MFSLIRHFNETLLTIFNQCDSMIPAFGNRPFAEPVCSSIIQLSKKLIGVSFGPFFHAGCTHVGDFSSSSHFSFSLNKCVCFVSSDLLCSVGWRKWVSEHLWRLVLGRREIGNCCFMISGTWVIKSRRLYRTYTLVHSCIKWQKPTKNKT